MNVQFHEYLRQHTPHRLVLQYQRQLLPVKLDRLVSAIRAAKVPSGLAQILQLMAFQIPPEEVLDRIAEAEGQRLTEIDGLDSRRVRGVVRGMLDWVGHGSTRPHFSHVGGGARYGLTFINTTDGRADIFRSRAA